MTNPGVQSPIKQIALVTVVCLAAGALFLSRGHRSSSARYTVVDTVDGWVYVYGNHLYQRINDEVMLRKIGETHALKPDVNKPALTAELPSDPAFPDLSGNFRLCFSITPIKTTGQLGSAAGSPGSVSMGGSPGVSSAVGSPIPGSIQIKPGKLPQKPTDEPNVSRMKWMGSFSTTTAALKPPPGIVVRPLKANARFNGSTKAPNLALYRINTDGNRLGPDLQLTSPLAVTSANRVYWLEDKPDLIAQTSNGKQYWNSVIGYSKLWCRDLSKQESKAVLLRESISDYIPLFAVDGGAVWVEQNPFPDKSQTLYYSRASDGVYFNCGISHATGRTGMAAANGNGWLAWLSASETVTEGTRIAKLANELVLCKLSEPKSAGEPGIGRQYSVPTESVVAPTGETLSIRDSRLFWVNNKLFCTAVTNKSGVHWYDQDQYICRVHIPDEGKSYIEPVQMVPGVAQNIQLNVDGIWFQVYREPDVSGTGIRNKLARMDWMLPVKQP